MELLWPSRRLSTNLVSQLTDAQGTGSGVRLGRRRQGSGGVCHWSGRYRRSQGQRSRQRYTERRKHLEGSTVRCRCFRSFMYGCLPANGYRIRIFVRGTTLCLGRRHGSEEHRKLFSDSASPTPLPCWHSQLETERWGRRALPRWRELVRAGLTWIL